LAFIAATAINFPPNYYPQEQLMEEYCAASTTGQAEAGLIKLLFPNTGVKGRYMTLTTQEIGEITGFGGANDRWIQGAVTIGAESLKLLLQRADMRPQDISQITFVSSTGLAIPSIEARLINHMPFSVNLKRMPLYGLGCMAGAGGLARVFDYLEGHPTEAVIFLAVELCSATFQITDYSVANIIACGLFGDGVGSVLVLGRNHPLVQPGQPQILGTHSVFIHQTERALGFDVVDSGLKIVLDPVIPELALKGIPPEVNKFLQRFKLTVADISVWLIHPGGPKVIQKVAQGLGIDEAKVRISYETLAEVGNLSSVSVLYMLDKVLAQNTVKPGSYGLMMGLGPGFSAELVLLKW